MRNINHDPYGVLATAQKLDPARCKSAVEKKLNKIRKSAGYVSKPKKSGTDFNATVMRQLIQKYGKNRSIK